MIKRLLKFGIYISILLFILAFYLSYFGVETNKFNHLIDERISKTDPNLRVELKKVKIFLNIKNFSLNVSTFEPILHVGNNLINLKKLSTNLSINSYLKGNFAIENIKLTTSKIHIKNLIKSIRLYQNNAQLFILEKIIKDGYAKISFQAEFDQSGKIKDNFILEGLLENTDLKLLNKNQINNANLAFKITKDQYFFKEIKLKFKELNLKSEKISLSKKNGNFFLQGQFENSKQKINSDILFLLFKNLDIEKLNINELIFGSKNLISFKIDKKFKFSNLKVKSEINLEELNFKPNKEDFYNFGSLIKIKKNKLKINYNKDKWSVEGEGKYSLDEKFDNIKYSLSSNNNMLRFKNSVDLNNIPIKIKLLNYHKNDDQEAKLNFEGEYKKNSFLNFNDITYSENETFLNLTKIFLDKNFKIINLNKLKLNFIDTNKKENNFFLLKSGNDYKLKSYNFDASIFLYNLLNDSNDFKFNKIFQNLNANIYLDFKKTFLDEKTYLNNLSGNIQFEKNKITNVSLNSVFFDNKKMNFSIRTNDIGERVTTLYSGNATPLVKKYKFIKGFSEGNLNFYSIKKNETSKSKLKINDFKLYELPVLTKILSLASLQGIADLLTGEGIRFNVLEMDFNSKGKLIKIEEMYAIGPSISILMNGYVETGNLVSLRGTLVPATTLNKVIGSIPIIGKILVGKKMGEGVFGVSFKIKGPPKSLKTTVNPIKTLTPRFITRALEKVKKLK